MKVKKFIGLSVALLLLAALTLPVFAQTDTFTLDIYAKSPDSYLTKGDFIPGVPFDIYYVAQYNESGSAFTLVSPFTTWNLDLSGMSDPATAQKAWIEQAESCASFIVGQGIRPTASVTADQTGHALFADRKTGLYLIHGAKTQVGDYVYDCGTFFVTVTEEQIVTVGGAPYAQINPKFSKVHIEPEPEYMNIRVTKVWKNDSSRVRPTTLRVRLYKNGELYDSVLLSKDNNWEYVWTGLEKNVLDEWTVCEECLSHYTMHLKKNVLADEIHFVFTNTYYTPPTPPPTPPDDPPSPPDTPEPPPPPEEKLIETGANWTLPAMLACFGLLALVSGLVLRRKAE